MASGRDSSSAGSVSSRVCSGGPSTGNGNARMPSGVQIRTGRCLKSSTSTWPRARAVNHPRIIAIRTSGGRGTNWGSGRARRQRQKPSASPCPRRWVRSLAIGPVSDEKAIAL